MRFPLLSTTFALCLASSCTFADEIYYGAGYSMMNYGKADATPSALHLTLGIPFNVYFTSELRVGLGMTEDSITNSETEVTTDYELKKFYGAYFRARWPLGDTFYPYATVGYTRAEMQATSHYGETQTSLKGTSSDLSYGIGMDILFDSGFTLTAEYMSYTDSSDSALSGISIGFIMPF